eukprot:7558548-Alexandrium_andersonii.AAC.1
MVVMRMLALTMLMPMPPLINMVMLVVVVNMLIATEINVLATHTETASCCGPVLYEPGHQTHAAPFFEQDRACS